MQKYGFYSARHFVAIVVVLFHHHSRALNVVTAM